jgi:hypothetical protein
LAISEEGRSVKTLRYTDPHVSDEHKLVLWLMARQHAFESHSSWYAEGLARWLNSDHVSAQQLRAHAIVYVTPIMDVDNVFNGGSGKEQLDEHGERADFNRSWGHNSPWAAIRGAQRLLLEAKATHDVAAFVDLHSPWYARPSYWGISTDHAPAVFPFADLWSACLAETDAKVCWKHDLRVRTSRGGDLAGDAAREPTQQGMVHSGDWARDNLEDDPAGHLYFLIETSHWLDGYGNFIDVRALHAYGEAMGRALSRWIVSR